MKQYVLRRVVLAVPTLFLVSVIVFAMMRLMPGDVATRMVEGHAYAPTLDALRKDLGLDRPVHVQYLEWVGGIVLRGDFGRSYWTRQPIWEEFVRRFPVTLELAALTILISVVIGVAVGIVSAMRQDTPADYIGRVGAILALSVPYFGLAVLVVVLPSIYFKWTPVWTYVPLTTDPIATTGLSTVIFTEASLSFLGLGVPPPYPTWGGMLSLAGLDHMYEAPGLAIWPAVALSLAVFGFNMLGDALRDLLDPRLRGG